MEPSPRNESKSNMRVNHIINTLIHFEKGHLTKYFDKHIINLSHSLHLGKPNTPGGGDSFLTFFNRHINFQFECCHWLKKWSAQLLFAETNIKKYDWVQAYLVLEIINTSKINEELLLLLTLLLAFHLLLAKILVVHFLRMKI